MNIEGLSLDQMQVALAVAQTGSFSAAARQVNRTQSALSYAVTALERQLGVPLFDRLDGRRPRPTETGRLLLREIETVLRQAHELKDKAKAIAAGLESEVGLILDAHFSLETILPLLRSFQTRFPTVQVRLTVDSMGGILRAVFDGAAVIGVLASVPELPAGLVADALPPIDRIPVVSPHHALASLGAGGARLPHGAVLEHVQIVLSDRSGATIGRDYAVHSGRTWRVSDLFIKLTLLLAGLGWGFMPEHLVAADLAAGRLQRLRVDGLQDRNSVAVLVVRLRDQALGPAARWTLGQLLQAAPE